jgi:hypothetical protein
MEQFKKDGYVEKLKFLDRVDMRRFEIEKEQRAKERYQRDMAAGASK